MLRRRRDLHYCPAWMAPLLVLVERPAPTKSLHGNHFSTPQGLIHGHHKPNHSTSDARLARTDRLSRSLTFYNLTHSRSAPNSKHLILGVQPL